MASFDAPAYRRRGPLPPGALAVCVGRSRAAALRGEATKLRSTVTSKELDIDESKTLCELNLLPAP